jgi:Fe-S cluster assembly ATP-binding protein
MKKKDILLNIENLKVKSFDTKQKNKEVNIIKGINLSIEKGLTHAIMGPNGSGKSTLSKVLAGHPSYQVTKGNITFKNRNLLECSPEERAYLGLFLGFQYPLEISGVTNQDFLRMAYNSKQKYNNKEEIDFFNFHNLITKYLNLLDMDSSFLPRYLNEGFSGGEKKKNEILQMSILDADLIILDEIDSGLDIDALKVLSKTILLTQVDSLIKQKNYSLDKSLLLITHYKRLLNYIEPDIIHIMKNGKIICSGDSKLSNQLEKKGYDWISPNNFINSIEFNTYQNIFKVSKNDKILLN